MSPPSASAPVIVALPAEPREGVRLPRPEAGPIVFRPWSSDLEEEARRRRAPLLVYVRADWAAPCRQLEQEVFVDPDVRRAASGFVPMSVDVTDESTTNNELLVRMQVDSMPCIKVVRVDGSAAAPRLDVGKCLPSTMDAKELAGQLDDVLNAR